MGCRSGTAEPATPAAAAPEAAPAAAAPAAAAPAASPAAAGAAKCADPVLDDLEDGDNRGSVAEDRGGYWYSFKDSNGSTLSPEGDFKPGDGGAANSKHAAHMSGKMGGSGVVYAGIGFNLTNPMAPYDLSKASGFCFDAKGTPGPVRVKVPDVNTAPEGGVCKQCYNDFGVDFSVTADWKPYCFKFSDLKQQSGWGEQKPAFSKEKAFSVQWQVTTAGKDYDVWVDNIKLTCE
jgi:hypothetical protein